MAVVTLATGKTFDSEQGTTLLDAAETAGLNLPHGCKGGFCGACKTEIVSGETTLEKEEAALSDDERQQGVVLTCCRSASGDVELAVEDIVTAAPVVELAGGVKFEAEGGKSILQAADDQGITLPHGCKGGFCGACRTELLDGDTEIVTAEVALSAEEQESGVILTCCREAKGDVKLSVEEVKASDSENSSVVQLANGKQFEVNEGQTILDAALGQELVLEHGCKGGFCGACKTEVVAGDTEVINDEAGLSAEDAEQGYILTCCRTSKGQLELAVKDVEQDVTIEAKSLSCTIEELGDLSHDVKRVVLKVEGEETMPFLAGQYLDVTNAAGVRRSYSMANAPREDGRIELHIRKVEQGAMSQYWFADAQTNDSLTLEGGLGTFSYRKTDAKKIVFLATGTGIAPVKAMLEQFAADPSLVEDKQIYVYWGNRIEGDLYWQPEFSSLNVQYKPVLSRAGDQWQGESGYIQQAVVEDGIELNDAVIYACGSEQMINSAQETAVANGLAADNFFSDAFVASC